PEPRISSQYVLSAPEKLRADQHTVVVGTHRDGAHVTDCDIAILHQGLPDLQTQGSLKGDRDPRPCCPPGIDHERCANHDCDDWHEPDERRYPPPPQDSRRRQLALRVRSRISHRRPPCPK